MLRTKHTYILIIVLALLWTFSTQPALAQDDASACESDSKQYTPWLEALDSLQGEVTAMLTNGSETASASGFFALVNNGEISNSDYFVQIVFTEEGDKETFALLVKDQLIAAFDGGWDVERREESYDWVDIENSFEQADSFLTSSFLDLRFIDMSECVGLEDVQTGDALHYRLTIPSLMGRMLIAQMTGEELTDIELAPITFDYWLDADQRFLTKLNTTVEANDLYSDENVYIDLTFDIASTDNVQLRIPYVVQFMAMENGIIEPDFIPEIVVTE